METLDGLFGEEGDEGALLGAAPAAEEEGAPVTIFDLFGEEEVGGAPAPKPTPTTKPRAAENGKALPAAALHLPSLPRLSDPSLAQVTLVRMPRIVGTAPAAFDRSTYDESAENAYLKSMDRSSASETLVRFRFKRDAAGAVLTDAEGRPERESNARVVEWQDGSLTLHVGKEVFSLRPAAREHAAEGSEAGAGAGAGAGRAPGAAPLAPYTGEQHFVYARVQSLPPEAGPGSGGRRETVLEAQAIVAGRYVVGGLAGSTVVAQSVLEARASRSRATKRQRVTQIAVEEDLEEQKNRRIKNEDEMTREAAVSKRKADLARDKDRRRGGGVGFDLSAGGDDWDGEGEGNTFSLKAIKRSAKSGKGKGADGGYDSQSQDEDED